MGSYCGPAVAIRKCAHGQTQFQRCHTCEEEQEAERERERARVLDPAWLIEQSVKHQRRWFHGCAFCPPPVDLVVHTVHRHDCPFVVALGEARIAYGLHLVAISEGRAPNESEGQ